MVILIKNRMRARERDLIGRDETEIIAEGSLEKTRSSNRQINNV